MFSTDSLMLKENFSFSFSMVMVCLLILIYPNLLALDRIRLALICPMWNLSITLVMSDVFSVDETNIAFTETQKARASNLSLDAIASCAKLSENQMCCLCFIRASIKRKTRIEEASLIGLYIKAAFSLNVFCLSLQRMLLYCTTNIRIIF